MRTSPVLPRHIWGFHTSWRISGWLMCMLLTPDIGFWAFVMDKMPDSRFLTQSDRFSFNELVQVSTLPSFITDLSEKHRVTPPGRSYVPISDAEATVSYYLVCKKEQAKDFDELFRLL